MVILITDVSHTVKAFLAQRMLEAYGYLYSHSHWSLRKSVAINAMCPSGSWP